jgi:very-short-patch-repair endonuclease
LPEVLLARATGLRPLALTMRDGELPYHYKLDLACPSTKLAIEIDGETHRSSAVQTADLRKVKRLAGKGWTVLRFTNREVVVDTTKCAQTVASTISRLLRESTSQVSS